MHRINEDLEHMSSDEFAEQVVDDIVLQTLLSIFDSAHEDFHKGIIDAADFEAIQDYVDETISVVCGSSLDAELEERNAQEEQVATEVADAHLSDPFTGILDRLEQDGSQILFLLPKFDWLSECSI